MGAEQSKSLSVSVTRDALLKSTTRTRDIVDKIFEFMIKNIQLRDFYSLSSPERCKRYVLFIANELYSKFYEFRIFPTLDRSGSIMFRKADEVTNPPEPERRRQQTACLHLAYFYVRIFQIYGALALTLVDDATYTQQTGIVGLMSPKNKDTLSLPGSTIYYPRDSNPAYTRGISMRHKYGQVGGDVFTSEELRALNLFQPLESILRRPVFSFGEARNKSYSIRFDTWGRSDIPDCNLIIGEDNTATIKCNNFKLKLTAELRDNSRVKIKFEDNVEIKRRGEDEEEIALSDILGSSESLSMVCTPPDGPTRPWRVAYGRRESDVPTRFKEILKQVIDYIDKPSRVNAIRRSWNTRRNVERNDRKYDETRADGKIFSEIPGTNPHLRLEAIVDGLTRKRKFAHCVGRAIQLLDSAPVFTGQVGARRVSYVCDPKFSKDSISGSAGVTLSSATGIIALANLFYDTIQPNMVAVTVDEKESLKEYIDFMRKITRVFTGKGISESDTPETMLRSLSQSETTPRDKEICSGKYEQPIFIEGKTEPDREFQRKVYSIVQALFRYQIVHASKCAEILLQLFEMNKVKGQLSMRIHPNIMKKGMAEINRIGKLARATLVEYYERCESMYLDGMQIVMKGPPTAVPLVLGQMKQIVPESQLTTEGVKPTRVPIGVQQGVKPTGAPKGILKEAGVPQRGNQTRRVQIVNEIITPP